MPEYISPKVFVEETKSAPHSISGVSTHVLGILGITEKRRPGIGLITSFDQFIANYGGYLENSYLCHAVKGFFVNGGTHCYVGCIEPSLENHLTANNFIGVQNLRNSRRKPEGLAALSKIDEINCVYIPDIHLLSDSEAAILQTALKDHCEQLADRIAIFDIPKNQQGHVSSIKCPLDSSYAAVYYPWLKVKNPYGRPPLAIPPGGHVAGIYSRADINHGVHKAPANMIVHGILEPERLVLSYQAEILNAKGINTIRLFEGRGTRVWGARTCSTDPEWKYVNIRRLFIYLEESIKKGLAWVVFEPNGEALWSCVRQSIGTFFYNSWRSGMFQGCSAGEAFFVKCDHDTMTQEDIDNGRLVCEVGVAAVRPAEFTILRFGFQTNVID